MKWLNILEVDIKGAKLVKGAKCKHLEYKK